MTQLVKLSTFIEQHFHVSSRPERATVKSWIDSGEVPGRRIGRDYYVDLDQFEVAQEDEMLRAILNESEKK